MGKASSICRLIFLFPLTAGFIAITLLFGSPLPQSACAKLYYHNHPADSWFPFLVNFTTNNLKFLLVVVGIEKQYSGQVLEVQKLKDGVLVDVLKSPIGLFKKPYSEIINVSLDFSGTDSVSIKISGIRHFIISEPIYELVYLKTE